MALSTEQHMSSASFLDVDVIIYEEFMERGSYIPHEPDRLMIFYSTIDRKRGTTKLYMVGNSISKVCPYIRDWDLEPIFKKLKQGEIETKIIHNEVNDVKIAIEFCQSSGGKTMAIGNAKTMIDKGSWQSDPQPKLPESRKNYKCLYRFGFLFKGFKFLCEFLKNKNGEFCWFVFPYYKDFNKKMIIISDEVKLSPYWQRDIYNLSINNNNLKNLLGTFRENKVFYSSDLCGTDFKQCIDFMIRK